MILGEAGFLKSNIVVNFLDEEPLTISSAEQANIMGH